MNIVVEERERVKGAVLWYTHSGFIVCLCVFVCEVRELVSYCILKFI